MKKQTKRTPKRSIRLYDGAQINVITTVDGKPTLLRDGRGSIARYQVRVNSRGDVSLVGAYEEDGVEIRLFSQTHIE